MSYPDSLRQQAKWIKDRLQGRDPDFDWDDIDLDELEDAAKAFEQLKARSDIMAFALRMLIACQTVPLSPKDKADAKRIARPTAASALGE